MIELKDQDDKTINLIQENQPESMDYRTFTLPKPEELTEQLDCKCRMNQNFFSDTKELSYNCRSCPNKMKNLCRYCMEVCHKSHRMHQMIDQFKDDLVSFLTNPCQCALNNHKVSTFAKHYSQENSKKDSEQKAYCHYNTIFSLTNPKYYYKRKEDKKVYCLYCLHNQPEDNPSLLTKEIPADKFNVTYEKCTYTANDYPSCSCKTSVHKHEMPIENLNNIISMYLDPGQMNRVNMLKLNYQFLTSEHIHNNYLTEYMIIQRSIIDGKNEPKSFFEKVDNRPHIKLEDKMDWDYFIKCDQLLSFVSKSFKCINFNCLNEYLDSFYNFDMVTYILKAQSNLSHNLFKIQKSNINMYRKFKVKSNTNSNYLFPEINISPLHRLMLGPQRNEETVVQLKELIDIIFNLLNEVEDSRRIPANEMNSMLLEGLKLVKQLIVYLRLNKEELIELYRKIEAIVSVFKEKKEGQTKSIKTLQRIIENIFAYINDYVIYEKLLNSEDEILNEEAKSKAEKNAKKTNEEPQFSFQNNDINLSIIQTLFSFEGTMNDDIEYIESKVFYDNLVNEKDYYIESLNSIIESPHMEKMFNNDLDYIKLIQGNLEPFYKINNHLEQDLQSIQSLIVDFNMIIQQLLNNSIDELYFLQKIKETFDKTYNIIQGGIFNEYNKKNLFKAQLLFVKLGYFNQLKEIILITQKVISVFTVINDINKPILEQLSLKEDEILAQFKNILLLMIQDNPFIGCILLSEENISLILNKKTINMDLYCLLGKMSKQYNYYLNYEELITYINVNFSYYSSGLKERYEKIVLLFRVFKYSLDYSTKKSILHVNNIIATHLADVIGGEEMITLFKAKELDMKEKQILKLVLKSIIHLQKEYFYLILPSIEIFPLKEKLNDLTITPDLRKVLFKIYVLYFLESYFSLIDFKSFYTENSTVLCNIIDNSENYDNGKICGKLQFIFNPKDKSISKEELILIPVIANLESFKYYHMNHDDSFKKSLMSLLNYFNEVIFLPSIYSIYKIAYFSMDLTASVKYNVYDVICLFLQCYKYIIMVMKERFDLKKRENEEAFEMYFSNSIDVMEKIAKESVEKLNSPQAQLLNLKLLINLFMNNIKSFKVYQKKFVNDNSTNDDDYDRKSSKEDNDYNNESSEHKLRPLIHNHYHHANSNPQELLLADIIKGNSFFDCIKDVYEYYIEKKSQYEEDNVLNELYSNEKYQNYQHKITIDLLLKLSFNNVETRVFSKGRDNMKSLKPQGFRCLQLEALSKRDSSNQLSSRKSARPSKAISITDTIKIETPSYYNNYINPYCEDKTIYIETIDRLFKTNPDEWQSIIVLKSQITKYIMNVIIEKQLPVLIQFIFIEFNRIDSSTTPYYQFYLLFLEFLRLLCEDHNPIFQTMLINYEKAVRAEHEERVFITFICRLPVFILDNIKHSLVKLDILKQIKRYDWEYFDPLLEKVTDFLIEIIQGAYSETFVDLTTIKEGEQRNGLIEYYVKHYQFLDYLDGNSEYKSIMAQFIRFLNCFIEENSNPLKNKIPVITKLNPKKLISSAINAFKKMIFKYVSPNIQVNCYKGLLDKFCREDKDLNEDPLFGITTGIFIYLKRVNAFKDASIGDKFKSILEDLNDLALDKSIIEEDSIKLLKKEYYLFCDALIKDAEISFVQDLSRDEKEVYSYKDFFTVKYKKNVLDPRNSNCTKKAKHDSIFFIAHPDSLLLQPRDTLLFLEKADYTNFNNKLNCILDYFPSVERVINIRKTYQTNGLLLYLYEIRYSKLETANAIICFIISLLLTLSSNGNIFDQMIFPMALMHLVFLSLIIGNWFFFHMKTEFTFKNNVLSVGNVLRFAGASMFDLEIFCFVWAFIWGLAGISFHSLRFLFSLQLFVIFNLFPTMRSVLYAIQVRYKQFLSTAFLLVILILFYAAVTFYFFRINDDGEELCHSYLECFLYLFNNGIRAGGVEFRVKIREHTGFWTEFIFSWVFYFIIILIILNIVNGIIVDTFQALREQNNEIDEEKMNVCYVCSLNRANFEMKGIDFFHHIIREHNITNYFIYILKIMRTDEHDLNSTDFQVFNLIKAKKIEFFPIKKAKCLKEAGHKD